MVIQDGRLSLITGCIPQDDKHVQSVVSFPPRRIAGHSWMSAPSDSDEGGWAAMAALCMGAVRRRVLWLVTWQLCDRAGGTDIGKN